MTETLHRLPLTEVSDLIAAGQPLPFRVLDAQGRLLLNTGHCIADARQLATLLDRGACVEFVEAEAERRRRAGLGSAATGFDHAVRARNLFDAWEDAIWVLDGLLRALNSARGGTLAGPDIEAYADAHIARVDREPEVALFLAVRQDDHRYALYSVTHAMHTATVALLAARVLGWPPARARQLVLAALTMNAAIVELQARMAEQTDAPTKRQIDEIRAHPMRSAALLRAGGIADEEWLNAVQDHHERGQGGYPRGTAEIGELARLLRAADVFTAKISPRKVRAALTPQAAARQLFQEEGGGPLAAALIRAVGLYPPGNFVTLKNGETAIVARHAVAPLGAQVLVLRDARGRALMDALRRDTARPEFAIAGPVADPGSLPRVLAEQVYGLLVP